MNQRNAMALQVEDSAPGTEPSKRTPLVAAGKPLRSKLAMGVADSTTSSQRQREAAQTSAMTWVAGWTVKNILA